MSTTTGSTSPTFSPYNSAFDFDATEFGSDYAYTSSGPISGTRPAPTAASILVPAQHPSLPAGPVRPQPRESNNNNVLSQQQSDPRRKFPCPTCPRSFARAFNLKTHMATHDPNRIKPHVCPHRSCGRSFSRKHDLGRHLVSIHRRDPPGGADGLKVHVKSDSGVGVGVRKDERQ